MCHSEAQICDLPPPVRKIWTLPAFAVWRVDMSHTGCFRVEILKLAVKVKGQGRRSRSKVKVKGQGQVEGQGRKSMSHVTKI